MAVKYFYLDTFLDKSTITVDFFDKIIYTNDDIGGVIVNEFEKDPQSKVNDVPGAIKGFTFSFVFFVLIFAIGVIMSFALK